MGLEVSSRERSRRRSLFSASSRGRWTGFAGLPLLLGLLALAVGCLAATPAAAQQTPGAETFDYEWRLRNFAGWVAGFFLPDRGHGKLTYSPVEGGLLQSELLITSPKSADGEYWRYGAEIQPSTGQTVRAWSSYLFRGETRSKTSDIEEDGVVDIASGIYLIRKDPPTSRRSMRIWSDGKIYPVYVEPLETGRREVGGKLVPVRHYRVVARKGAGGQAWKGRLDLWLTRTGEAQPVEIRIRRSLADVQLRLAPGGGS